LTLTPLKGLRQGFQLFYPTPIMVYVYKQFLQGIFSGGS